MNPPSGAAGAGGGGGGGVRLSAGVVIFTRDALPKDDGGEVEGEDDTPNGMENRFRSLLSEAVGRGGERPTRWNLLGRVVGRDEAGGEAGRPCLRGALGWAGLSRSSPSHHVIPLSRRYASSWRALEEEGSPKAGKHTTRVQREA